MWHQNFNKRNYLFDMKQTICSRAKTYASVEISRQTLELYDATYLPSKNYFEMINNKKSSS